MEILPVGFRRKIFLSCRKNFEFVFFNEKFLSRVFPKQWGFARSFDKNSLCPFALNVSVVGRKFGVHFQQCGFTFRIF